MAFRGVFPAPKIEPTEFGLFAVAKPNEHTTAAMDEQWNRGFYQMYNTLPNYVRNWDETSSTSYVVSSNPGSPLFRELTPIFLEVEDYRSTFDLPAEDKFSRALLQLEGVSQKALEYELWNGEIALAQGLPNTYLSQPTVTVIGNGTAYSSVRAMSLLEHYAGEVSPAGEHGVIHLTRDAFFLIATNSGVFIHSEGKEHIQTATGTPVIIGSGYSGDGPHIVISTIAVSTNTVTVITATPHFVSNNDSVEIDAIVGVTDFSGTYTVTKVNGTTFTFTKTTGDISATAPTGIATAQMKATDDVKWIYATGRVDVLLGEPIVVTESLAQGYDVSGNKNDVRIKATRSGIAYFDPSIHLAIKVDLTV